ncbi:MAG: transketolase-like TK C-terminal-containing protein, partial [Gammaproteobacteria bacterium]
VEFGVAADVWSVTSFTELRREGLACERWNALHPHSVPRISYIGSCLSSREGPVVAATDYMRSYADQIRAFVPRRYVVLGNGFGRSDTRERLRRFFEVDHGYIVLAALTVLAEEGTVPRGAVSEALEKYGIGPERPDPAVS